MANETPGETPAERRLRELIGEIDAYAYGSANLDNRDAIDAGREAIALLRRYKSGELNWMAFDGLMRALLARCEGDAR